MHLQVQQQICFRRATRRDRERYLFPAHCLRMGGHNRQRGIALSARTAAAAGCICASNSKRTPKKPTTTPSARGLLAIRNETLLHHS